MIYFATPSGPAVRAAMAAGHLGCITTPAQGGRPPPGVPWCADNGCGPRRDGSAGTSYVGDEHYLGWLADLVAAEGADPCDPDQSGLCFAVCPDVVADAGATARRAAASGMLGWMRYLGVPVAYAAQDGLIPAAAPWDDFDVLFIGGSTRWKLGADARQVVAEARRQGKRVHMGRVNTLRRLQYAAWLRCDSVDGTTLAIAPDQNLPKVLRYLASVHGQGELWELA